MSSVKGLDQRLQDILMRPEFLEMRGVAKEVPIFIQTYSPSDDDELRRVVDGTEQVLRQQGIRVKQVDLFELVLELLDAKGYLDVVLEEEPDWSKSDLFLSQAFPVERWLYSTLGYPPSIFVSKNE